MFFFRSFQFYCSNFFLIFELGCRKYCFSLPSRIEVYHVQKSNNLKCNKSHFERMKVNFLKKNMKKKRIGRQSSFVINKELVDKLIEIVWSSIELLCRYTKQKGRWINFFLPPISSQLGFQQSSFPHKNKIHSNERHFE